MRFLCITIALGALAAPAATIDVSTQTTQILKSGDSLAFLFTDSGYARLAPTLGLTAYPSQVFFNLMSAPAGSAGQFTVELESEDGSASSQITGPVGWTSGMVETSQYSGAASILMDNLTLSNAISQEIFAGSEAELILTYTGPNVTVGLPGYSLEHDLMISLAGGPLTIGAMNYGVTLDEGSGSGSDPAAATPEPGSAALIFAVGISLCAVSVALKRFGRSRKESDRAD